MEIEDILYKLSKSKFRSSFHLKQKDLVYVNNKGISVIKKHAYDFVEKRLKPSNLKKDGKQTPYKGHPVFIAQHATATCCRGCLNKWYHISKDKNLTDKEVDFIVNLIINWIIKETDRS